MEEIRIENIPVELKRAVKAAAALSGRSMIDFLIQLMTEAVGKAPMRETSKEREG